MSESREESEIYTSALQRTFKELESRVLERKRQEALRRSLEADEEERLKRRNEERKIAYLRNAEDLRSQISINLSRKHAELREKKSPGIPAVFNGFPNIRDTPAEERLQKKRAQQLSIKEFLDLQIRVKQEAEQRAKRQLKTEELENNEKAKAEIERKRLEEIEKKHRFQFEFRKANEAAEAAKHIMKTIEGMKDLEIDPAPVTDFLEIQHFPTADDRLLSSLTERSGGLSSREDRVKPEETLPKDLSKDSKVPGMKQIPSVSRRSKSNQNVPAPIVTVYKPSDQRDGSLNRSLGGQKLGPVTPVATLPQNMISPRSRTNLKWGFVTGSDPNKRTKLHAAGLKIIKSQPAIKWPVISTVKTMELQQSALPQYGMMLTKPRTINIV